ncbi:hypothetical protein BY996DRAFT_8686272 [Phakopsora pachyrhizi]|nr:hypothetical protein BY996DRAFT_8686272 [Phakopsora pachyrhizi]
MTPLENNTHLFGTPFSHPTVLFLRPISSPPTFLNPNTGYITEHNEMEQDDNSNGISGHNEDEEEEEDNDANEVNTLVKNQRGTSVTNKLSVNQQLANPNLKNYQGTLTKSETNPIDINMEASSQDAIFDGKIEVITKEAFLKNITVANRHLCLVIDNPSLPSYIQGKVKEAIDLLCADEEKVISGQPLPLDSNIKIGSAAMLRKRKRPKNKKVLKNKKTFTAAPETSSGLENNIITVNNPGIANSTQTISYDQQANNDESEANSMLNPDTQEPQSITGVQTPSQVETSNFLTCSNISHQPTNSNASGDPNNIHSNLMVGPPDSNLNSRIESVELPNYLPSGIKIKSDYGTSISQWLKHLDDVAPVKFVPQQVTTENPLSVEYALAGFLASCFSFNKNRGAILPMEGFHVLIAINMVQAHAKCQDNPAGPSSSIRPKRLERPLYCLLMAFCATGVRGLMLGSNNWRKCGALESLQIITLSNEILKLKGKDFEEPYWPRTSKYILQIIKSCFLPADPKSHKPMCPSRYEIAKCIVLDFGDTWHSKVDDSRKQHLSLPKKALVNAVISELS